MSNYRKHIDDFFREKLGNYKETPPPEAWEELNLRLDDLTPAAIPTSPYRWIWHAGIVSLLLVLGISAGRKIMGNSYTAHEAIAAVDNTTTTRQTAVPAAATKPVAQVAAQNANTITDNNNIADNNNNDEAGNNENAGGNEPQGRTGTAANYQAAKNTSTRGRRHRGSKVNDRSAAFRHSENGTGAKPQAGYSYTKADSKTETETDENTQSATSPLLALSANNKPAALPGTFKKEPAVTSKTGVTARNEAKDSKAAFRRFDAGVKAGYERGFDNTAASKLVISPYLQYNLSPKFALMVQPAAKYAGVSTKNLGEPQSYYNVTNTNPQQNTTPNYEVFPTSRDTTYTTIYKYSETHDSIVKSYKYGGTYYELELPILLKYNLSKKIAVYGGVNLVYTQSKLITENTFTKTGIIRSLAPDTVRDQPHPPDPNYSPEAGFTYTGTPYKDYKDPYNTQQAAQLNIGYMVGFTYNYNKHWLFDVLMQQAPKAISGSNNEAPLSTTYFRLSLGYKLTK